MPIIITIQYSTVHGIGLAHPLGESTENISTVKARMPEVGQDRNAKNRTASNSPADVVNLTKSGKCETLATVD
jgi:hypothetical protein